MSAQGEAAMLAAIKELGRTFLTVERIMDPLKSGDEQAIKTIAQAMALVGEAQSLVKAGLSTPARRAAT